MLLYLGLIVAALQLYSIYHKPTDKGGTLTNKVRMACRFCPLISNTTRTLVCQVLMSKRLAILEQEMGIDRSSGSAVPPPTPEQAPGVFGALRAQLWRSVISDDSAQLDAELSRRRKGSQAASDASAAPQAPQDPSAPPPESQTTALESLEQRLRKIEAALNAMAVSAAPSSSAGVAHHPVDSSNQSSPKVSEEPGRPSGNEESAAQQPIARVPDGGSTNEVEPC